MKARGRKSKQKFGASVKNYNDYNKIVKNKKNKNRWRKKRNGKEDEIKRGDNMKRLEEYVN